MCLAAILASSQPAFAQHNDVLVQGVDLKLTTGTVNLSVTPPLTALHVRVFSRTLPAGFAVNNPGFNAIGTSSGTVPPGSEALPGDTDLNWDFLPMKTAQGQASLLYWNAQGSAPTDVSFGPPPGADYSLALFGKNNARAAADISYQLISGHAIATTASDGFFHVDRFFFLDNDLDDQNATVAQPGIYLVALRLRMAGLDRSDPFYIVWSTPTGVSAAARTAAEMWVSDHVDELAPDFAADFDGDLCVNGADFLAWQRGFGKASGALQIEGDANGDHAVSTADFHGWQEQFATNLATFVGTAAAATSALPEPTGGAVIVAAMCAMAAVHRRTVGPSQLRGRLIA
jgi:hypothetical protein